MKELIFPIILFLASQDVTAQGVMDSLFEDVQFKALAGDSNGPFFTSKEVDFVQIRSSITDSVKFAISVYKPEKPSPILILSHGWHMSVKPPDFNTKNPFLDFLTIQVDMRGRKYSTGEPDCNGYELYDFYDAYQYALRRYKHYISNPDQVYFLGGSGGGGNGYALLGKFPDTFCSAVILAGVSDYAEWFAQDTLGEFRDEMIPWIGSGPTENPESYRSRSGITTVNNILTPVYIVHGESDVRVPVSHSRNFVAKGKMLNKEIHYLELDNVGTREHWGNITNKQEELKNYHVQKGLEFHSPPKLINDGELIISGYLVTKHFSVFLDSIDSVGIIRYDLKRKEIEFVKGEGKFVWHKNIG